MGEQSKSHTDPGSSVVVSEARSLVDNTPKAIREERQNLYEIITDSKNLAAERIILSDKRRSRKAVFPK